ncbi:MAG: FliM/FliN family flagellar motor switch protein [Pseudomonadota bacterium]
MTHDTATGLGASLSDTEVDDLVKIAQNGAARPTATDVKPYQFGHDNLAELSDHNGLEVVNERFCRIARERMFQFLRTYANVNYIQPGAETYENFRRGLDPFLSMTLVYVPEIRANCLVVMRPDFVSLLTNTYFGGPLEYLSTTRRDFTESEARVRSLFVQELLKGFEQAWREIVPLSFEVKQHEDSLAFLHFVEEEDQVLRSSFIVELPEVDPALIEVLYPVQALKSIAPEIRAAMQSTAAPENVLWRARFHRALIDIPLTLTARLAEVDLPLHELAQLKTGKVLPLNADLSPQLLIEDARLFDVVPGKRGRRAAVSLERKLDRSTEGA